MRFETLLDDSRVPIEELAEWLDAVTDRQRVDAVFSLDRGGQRRLFRLAATAPAIGLEHFVPEEIADRRPVHHRGRNSLPLPKKHKLFEKRFCRPSRARDRLFGYNEAASRRLIGPGYFIALDTASDPTWGTRGAVVVDYFRVPDEAVVEGWPPVVPNRRGLQFFVYNGTRDFMRRVSRHVSIGAAYKGEKALDHYFVLVREEAPS